MSTQQAHGSIPPASMTHEETEPSGIKASNHRVNFDRKQINQIKKSAAYVTLLVNVMKSKNISINMLSGLSGISRQTFSRRLKDNDFTYDELRALYITVGIDWHCATIAIEEIKDWSMFGSETVKIAASIAKQLPAALENNLNRDILPISSGQSCQLIKEIAQRIAKNDEETLKRREKLQ